MSKSCITECPKAPLQAREAGWPLCQGAWFPMGRTISYAAIAAHYHLVSELHPWTRVCRTWLRITHCSISTVVTLPEVITLATVTFRLLLGRWSFRAFPQFDSVATLETCQSASSFTSIGFADTFTADSRSFRGCWHQTCPPVVFTVLFKYGSLHTQCQWHESVISINYLPELGLGNLRACCLP